MNSIALLFLVILFAVNGFSQKTAHDTLQTDDGELTMTMPSGCYSNFYNRDGVTVYDYEDRQSIRLTAMRLISCFHDGALLNVEIYESNRPKSAAQAMRKSLKLDGELNLGKKFYAAAKIENAENYTLEQRVVASRKRLYLITAAARAMPNETMRTFLDSVRFAEDGAKPDGKSVLISSLENRIPELITEKDAAVDTPPTGKLPPADKAVRDAIPVSKPAPAYTNEARKYETTGSVRLKLTLNAQGSVTRLQVLRDLPNGLVREAVIAALRTKFLPAELDGKPHSATALVEYSFGTK